VEVCLTLALLVPPLVFGGREAFGQLVLAAIVLVGGTAWVLRRSLEARRSGGIWRPEVILPLAGLGLSVLVWAPVPSGVVRFISPGVGRLLPGWSDGTLAGLSGTGWSYFSLAPGLSRDGTLQLFIYVLLFWMALDTVRGVGDVRWFMAVFF